MHSLLRQIQLHPAMEAQASCIYRRRASTVAADACRRIFFRALEQLIGAASHRSRPISEPDPVTSRILLLLNTLATFASWLAGLGCEATGIAHWLSPHNSQRKLYSTLRVGREALVRHWPMEPVSRWLDRLRTLPDAVREHMTLVL